MPDAPGILAQVEEEQAEKQEMYYEASWFSDICGLEGKFFELKIYIPQDEEE